MPRIANRVPSTTEAAADERRDALVQAARDRAARNLGGLAQLLEERPELRGVHPPADLAAEAIRWTA
jgi:glutathione S-transferase